MSTLGRDECRAGVGAGMPWALCRRGHRDAVGAVPSWAPCRRGRQDVVGAVPSWALGRCGGRDILGAMTPGRRGRRDTGQGAARGQHELTDSGTWEQGLGKPRFSGCR